MPSSPLVRVRRISLALPEAHEVEAWGEPTFRVRNRMFVMYASPGNHHGGGRPAIWCKAAPGHQGVMVAADASRFFVPPYVGKAGWIGIRLDDSPDWEEVGEIIAESWKLVAPKKLVKEWRD